MLGASPDNVTEWLVPVLAPEADPVYGIAVPYSTVVFALSSVVQVIVAPAEVIEPALIEERTGGVVSTGVTVFTVTVTLAEVAKFCVGEALSKAFA